MNGENVLAASTSAGLVLIDVLPSSAGSAGSTVDGLGLRPIRSEPDQAALAYVSQRP